MIIDEFGRVLPPRKPQEREKRGSGNSGKSKARLRKDRRAPRADRAYGKTGVRAFDRWESSPYKRVHQVEGELPG